MNFHPRKGPHPLNQIEIKNLLFPLVFLTALATPAAGQLFPYDRIDDVIYATDTDGLNFLLLNEHTRLFKLDTVTFEVYFEPTEIIPRTDGWWITTRCIETVFMGKKQVAGSFYRPFNDKGRYTLLFYRDGCYMVQETEFLPDGSSSTHFEIFGRCPPQKYRKL